MKKRRLSLLVLFSVVCMQTPALADARDDILQLYKRFVDAQNAHDITAVRGLLSDSPDFLWVSDGRPVWGADATVSRMSSFQQSAVWRVVPALDRSRTVVLSGDVGFLHLPLVLTIGSKEAPDQLPFLVEMVARRGPNGWKIEALLTTGDKSQP
jgi:hypothetical protein